MLADSITLTLEASVIVLAILALRKAGPILNTASGQRLWLARRFAVLLAVSLWLLAGLWISTGIWAVVLLAIDAFPDWQTSLYFSMVAFTTLGLGDVTLPNEWRLLSGFIAANGLLLFSMTTAFLIEVMKQISAPGPVPP